MTLRQVCHCGHDVLSHALDPYKPAGAPRVNCLAMYCQCKKYINEWDPPAPPAPKTWPNLFTLSDDTDDEDTDPWLPG